MILHSGSRPVEKEYAGRTLISGISSLAGVLLLALLCSGCASPKAGETTSAPADNQPKMSGSPAMTLHEPISKIQSVTVDALESLNCATKVESTYHIRGQCASGEIIHVFLRAAGPNETQLWIKSHRTFVGGAWQRDRHDDVIWAINKVMSQEHAP